MQQLTVAILGSGPAGLTAALYAARAKLTPTIFAGTEIGGQLMYTTEIENFPGIAEGTVGPRLMMSMQDQAKRFGSQLLYENVYAVDLSQRPFKLWTHLPAGITHEEYKSAAAAELKEILTKLRQETADYQAQALLLATGAASIMLGVPGEKDFFGHGVSVCAVCDAAFYKDKTVYVVGGGDSAMEDATALSKFTDKVTIVHRRESFKASKIMQDRVLANPHIKVLWNSQITAILGEEQKVKKIKIEIEGKSQELPADGVFLAIGHRPNTAFLAEELLLDEHGYIVTRGQVSAASMALTKESQAAGLTPYLTMTSVEGVFAAGDVTDPRYKQAIVSAGMGAAAALDIEKWLEKQPK